MGDAATIVTRMGGDAGLPGTAAPARGQLRRALERSLMAGDRVKGTADTLDHFNARPNRNIT